MMRKKLLLLALLVWALSCNVEAVQLPPGKIPPNQKLSQIAPPELQQACLWLEQGRMKEARRAFEEALGRGSRNYVAAYGWLQTTTAEERKSLSRAYQEALKQSPTAMNYFKAALLYQYLAYDTNDLIKRGDLFVKCGEYARKAYQLDPNPYVIILLYDCPMQEALAMLEEQMGSILGKASMRFYLEARRQNRWQPDALPPMEHLSLQNLRLLRAIVLQAYPIVLSKERGWIVENKPDPNNPKRIQVLGRYTAQGQQIRKYFRAWIDAIDQAIERKQKG